MTEAVLADAQAAEPKARERPWHRFFRAAVAAGVSDELSALGREVMREAIQRRWGEDARIACGALDEGAGMVRLALADPARAERLWSRLLELDGRLPSM